MSDSLKPSLDLAYCRAAKLIAARSTTNNNYIEFKKPIRIPNNRRRKSRRSKTVNFTMDVEMTGQSGQETDSSHIPPYSQSTMKKPEHQYSREELIELMTHPLSSVKHPCLDSPQNKSLLSGKSSVRWLEDRWDHRKRTDSLTDEDRSDNSLDPQKKRMNDPKAERLRKEQDVVLSPQRRSFNSGCFVNLSSQHVNSTNRRPESPLKGERESNHRDLPSRRIGSGRIMRDPMWDFRNVEKEEVSNQNINNHDFNFRQRDDRFERRTFERPHDKERQAQRNPRYNNSNERRKYDKNEPEEPEWFSGGPTSQHDTIELHGFDGPVEEKTPTSKKQNKNNKNNTKSSRKVAEALNNKSELPSGKKSSSRKSSPDVLEHPRLAASPIREKQTEKSESVNQDKLDSPGETSAEKSSSEPDCLFDIEDFLNFDTLPPLLAISNGCVDERGSGSRFSQFFRRDSPSPSHAQRQDSQHSSAHDEMFNSMINDITSTNIAIPLDGEAYFAPISPAASSIKEETNKGPSASLLEMLQRGNQGFQGRKITKKPSLKDLEACGKIHSVEELEARLRQEQGIGKPVEYVNRPCNREEDLAAFRKLMMSKQIQNMQDQKSSSHSSGGLQGHQQTQHGSSQQPTMSIPHDLVVKLLHVQQQQQQQQRQQEVFAKLLVPPSHLAPSSQFSVPPPHPPLSPDLHMHISSSQPNKDILQRPEAQTILRSLKRGEITILHLMEQLKRNTNMQPLHREILASIIKLHGVQSNMNQREPSPSSLAPPSTAEQMLHQMMHSQQTQQQQLRIPSPHANAFGQPTVVSPNLSQTNSSTLTIQHPHPVLQRVPSPRELVAHTQNILQNALLKKKLEEQKENFRKRQELQRSHSPNVSVGGHGSLSPANQQLSTTSPTPLAFTPTSVLRKMTADKDNELCGKHHQQTDTSQQPPKQDMMVHANGSQTSEMMKPKPYQQLPNTWNLLKPIQGRAIVKGNNTFSVPPPVVPSSVDYMSMSQQLKAGNIQRNKLQQSGGNPSQQFMLGMSRNNIQPPSSRVRNMGVSNMVPQQQQQQQGMTQSVQQLLMNHNYNSPQQRNNAHLKPDCQSMMRGQGQSHNHNQMSVGRSYNMGYQEGPHELSTSPVSNQLARWFSPELLAQARAGKLPDMPPISPTQNMLSVEELERLQQAVHN